MYRHHPLTGLTRVFQALAMDQTCQIPKNPPTPEFPQLDVTSGEGWSVWPVWCLAPLTEAGEPSRFVISGSSSGGLKGCTINLDFGDGLCWVASGLDENLSIQGMTRIRLASTPGEPALISIFDSAMAALTRWRGDLPWRELNVLIEIQNPDSKRERGYAHCASDGSVWCRALVRPSTSVQALPVNRAEAVELVVHELLHLLLEFDTPPGHLLTEGIITYLAKLLLMRARTVPQGWIDRQNKKAISEIRGSSARQHSLNWCTARFFDNLEARRVAYRKGQTAMAALDKLLGGQLYRIARDLSRLSASRGTPLSEADFLSRITPEGRHLYRRALSETGEKKPGTQMLSKMRGRAK